MEYRLSSGVRNPILNRSNEQKLICAQTNISNKLKTLYIKSDLTYLRYNIVSVIRAKSIQSKAESSESEGCNTI